MLKKIINTSILLIVASLFAFTNRAYAWDINDAPISYELLTLTGSPTIPIDGNIELNEGVVVDSLGNIYVLDGTGRVSKYSSTYVFLDAFDTIVEGEESSNPVDIAINSDDILYIADHAGARKIKKFSTAGTYLGDIVTGANTYNIAVDASDFFYFGEYNGASSQSQIYRYDSSGEFVETLNTTTFYNGKGFDFDSNGDVYFLRTQLNQDDRVYLHKYLMGPRTTSQINRLFQVTNSPTNLNYLNLEISSDNTLYITGGGALTQSLIKYTTGAVHIGSYLPSGFGNGELYLGTTGSDLFVTSDKIFITDEFHGAQVFNLDASSYLGHVGQYGRKDSTVINPQSAAQGSDGNYYILNGDNGVNNIITVLDSEGEFVRNVFLGIGIDNLFDATWMSMDSAGYIYVSDINARLVRKLSNTGEIQYTIFGTQGDSEPASVDGRSILDAETEIEIDEIHKPGSIAFKSNGEIYIANQLDIVVINAAGAYVRTVISDGFENIRQITFDSEDNLYVADDAANRIFKFDSSDTFVEEFGVDGSGAGEFESYSLGGVAVDSLGFIYVTENVKESVLVFSPDGDYIRSFDFGPVEEGGLYFPNSLTFTSDQSLMISDGEDEDSDRDNLLVMVFDRVAPSITISKTTDVKITGTANDSLTPITDIDVKLDSGSWSNCTAVDGEFDSSDEDFSCKINSDDAKKIYVRAIDSRSNQTIKVTNAVLGTTTTDSSPTIATATDDESTDDITKIEYTVTITDDKGNPIVGAQVTVFGEEYTTDSEGKIVFESSEVPETVDFVINGKPYSYPVVLSADDTNIAIQVNLDTNEIANPPKEVENTNKGNTDDGNKKFSGWYIYVIVFLVAIGAMYKVFKNEK